MSGITLDISGIKENNISDFLVNFAEFSSVWFETINSEISVPKHFSDITIIDTHGDITQNDYPILEEILDILKTYTQRITLHVSFDKFSKELYTKMLKDFEETNTLSTHLLTTSTTECSLRLLIHVPHNIFLDSIKDIILLSTEIRNDNIIENSRVLFELEDTRERFLFNNKLKTHEQIINYYTDVCTEDLNIKHWNRNPSMYSQEWLQILPRKTQNWQQIYFMIVHTNLLEEKQDCPMYNTWSKFRKNCGTQYEMCKGLKQATTEFDRPHKYHCHLTVIDLSMYISPCLDINNNKLISINTIQQTIQQTVRSQGTFDECKWYCNAATYSIEKNLKRFI